MLNIDQVFALSMQNDIPSNSDLNNYTTNGNYTVNTNAIAETTTHIPVQVAGRLVVLYSANGNNYKRQLYLPYNDCRIYTRLKIASSDWTSWYRLEATSI